MSRLTDIDLQIPLEPEPEGYEFGYYTFDSLPMLVLCKAVLALSIFDTYFFI